MTRGPESTGRDRRPDDSWFRETPRLDVFVRAVAPNSASSSTAERPGGSFAVSRDRWTLNPRGQTWL